MLRTLPLLVLVLSAVLVSCVDGQTKITKQRFKKCPRNCKCFRATGTEGLDVDCSDKGLTDLPLLPRNTITLVMSENQLLQILPRSFTGTKRIEKMYLYRNRIKRVHWEAFQGLNSLQFLSLFGNEITQINNGSFKDLSSLKRMYLYENQISRLNKKTFIGLSSLEFLSLRHNSINFIEPGTFAPLGKLKTLVLFHNNLTKLTNGMFDGLTSLRTLIIGFNGISDIQNEAFKGLPLLTELYLDHNKLERISSRMFADLISLQKLHIYNNDIKTIDPGSFFRLQELTMISAHNNKLNVITRGTFAGLKSLQTLQLQVNEIEHLGSKSFVDLRVLRTLYLYQNKISTILKNTFLGLENLVDLHLGFNMISEIEDNAFQELKRLTTMYLDSNKLTRIPKGTFAGLKSLLDLYLYFNQISYVANNAFVENALLRYIVWDVPLSLRSNEKYKNIPGNVLFCDCHAMYFKRWLSKHPVIEASCHEPQKLRGVALKTLTEADIEKCHDPQVKTELAVATVEEGGQISLHCTGMPVVEFIWYINGSKIANKENSHINPFGTLVLSNIKRPDAGMYVCAATNKKGFAFSTVSLNVGHKPYFSSSPQSVEVFEGSKIILPCKVMSEPSSTISWKKYEDAVELDDERIFQTFEGTLVIMDVSLSDEGVYSCTGENELGSISKEIQVLVKQGKEIKEEQNIKCQTNTATEEPTEFDLSGSGSGNDDDGGDDDDDGNGDILSNTGNRFLSNHSIPTTSQR